jgi:hypothetical protein
LERAIADITCLATDIPAFSYDSYIVGMFLGSAVKIEAELISATLLGNSKKHRSWKKRLQPVQILKKVAN